MKKAVISVSVFFSLLIVAPSVYAQADSDTTHTRTELSANLVNPCNGEVVPTEANQLEVLHVTDNDNGFHFHITTKIRGVGVGLTTGAKYQLSAVSTANGNVVGGEEQTLWQDFVFSAQGDVPNFLVQLVRHFTINANGEMTISFMKFFTKCN